MYKRLFGVVVVVVKKAYYLPQNSLCGLINNISMQYDYLTSLVMSGVSNIFFNIQSIESVEPCAYPLCY